MLIAVARIELRFRFAHSLKEKRKAMRSIIDRCSSKFGIKVSEVDGQDSWQRAVLGLAVVGGDANHVCSLRDKVADHILSSESATVVLDDRELIHFGDQSLLEAESLEGERWA